MGGYKNSPCATVGKDPGEREGGVIKHVRVSMFCREGEGLWVPELSVEKGILKCSLYSMMMKVESKGMQLE